MPGLTIRSANSDDLPAIARLQAQSPEAAQWDPPDYLRHDVTVAICAGQLAGFAVARQLVPGESEILNLAVDPKFRRRGIGRTLVHELTERHPGAIFLEVRESNHPARQFYESLGFQVVTVRSEYYDSPPESAIVMKFHSC